MNLTKVFKEELWSALMMIIIFGYHGNKNSLVIGIIFIVMIWVIYYFIFIRFKKEFKLDERELFIYTKIGYTSVFIFLSVLTILYVYQEATVPYLDKPISFLWGRFILPIFISIHGITGLIYCSLEEKQPKPQPDK